MIKFILLLYLFYSSSPRVDVITTDLSFSDPIACNEFKLSEQFRKQLKITYSNHIPPVELVKPVCKAVYSDNEVIAYNGSKGICAISPCVW
tara:strand:+ start:107 stop:379 length:273 start_codon:yes stop_codon:yes gene_type:complete